MFYYKRKKEIVYILVAIMYNFTIFGSIVDLRVTYYVLLQKGVTDEGK